MPTRPSTPPPEPTWGQPWDRPVNEEHNIGVPASTPYSEDQWSPLSAAHPHDAQGHDAQAQRASRPGFAPPDPAAVGGPPWPRLVAVGHFVAPPMIRWPIVVGLVALIGVVVPVTLLSGSTTLSHRVWIAEHIQTINAINHDLQLLNTDNPSKGGSASKWLADWEMLHSDAGSAATVPNPGGSADVPWREMINNYYNGSAEIVQGIGSNNEALIATAEKSLAAGDRAAARFNHDMGVSPP